MIHIKILVSNRLYFAAQSKSQESVRARTEKAWRRASKEGQCAASMIWKLICICLMMLFILFANYEIYNKSFAQQDGIYSARNAAGNCHQGRFPRQTANKVSHDGSPFRACRQRPYSSWGGVLSSGG